jgi:glycosyltransferase involved in cell wall biosynthesis
MLIGVDIRVLGTGRTSGVEEYTERLLEHLILLDPNVHYKLFYAGRRALVRRPWMDAPNVQLYDTGRSNRLLWATTRLTGRPYLDRLVGGADIFFFPHFLLGATSPQCRRVLTVHDLSFERFPELFSVSRRLWHRFQMRPRVQVRGADRVIAVSESTRQDVIDLYGIPAERAITVPSGVDSSLVRPPEGDIELFRKEHGLPARFILMLGTVEPRKNIECVITAFERLDRAFDDVHLVIVGPLGWLWRGIMRQVHQSSVRDRIQFVDAVLPSERVFWLSAASVLAYPSLLEGFGFPPLEAIACGTPAVVSANSSMLQACPAALAVNPYSVSQTTASFAAVLGDMNLRRQLIGHGRRIIENFSWERTATETLRHMIQ